MGSIENQVVMPTINQEDEAGVYALFLTSLNVFPRVMKVANNLGLFDIIAKKTGSSGTYISASEIAQQLSAKNPDAPSMLARMLYLLASHSVLDCSLHILEDDKVERLYGMAPAATFFVKNADGSSFAPFFELNDQLENSNDIWNGLSDAILEGNSAFVRATGMSIYEYTNANPMYNEVFNTAMHNHSKIVMKNVLQTYKGFEDCKSLVDVGGGTGASLHMIVTKYPFIKGVNFDLPHVIKVAPPLHGIEHFGGDMFVSIPKSEAILMKWISHTWDDEHFFHILRNSYEALPENGKVIIIECVMPLAPDKSMATKYVSQLDNFMLLLFGGGKERSKEEFEKLSKKAGFSDIRLHYCAYATWVIEICK